MAGRTLFSGRRGIFTLPVLAGVDWRRWAPYLIVFFSGANLMLIQWVMNREVTTLLLGWSFIFAADDLPFTREALDAALRESGEEQFSTFDTVAMSAIVGGAPPITLDSMDIVLRTSAEWISERLHWGET